MCVDASKPMLELAKKRIEATGRGTGAIEFVHADAALWRPQRQSFDLVVTHFFLDCFRPEQLDRIVARMADAARPDAAWLLADFQIPSRGIRRCRALVIHRLMYWFFRVVTRLPARHLTPVDPLLQKYGFRLRERSVCDWDLLHSDWWIRQTNQMSPP